MQSLTDLNELAELLLSISYAGLSDGEGIDGISQIPRKDSHSEGLGVKHHGAYIILERMDSDIWWVIRKTNQALESMLRKERGLG